MPAPRSLSLLSFSSLGLLADRNLRSSLWDLKASHNCIDGRVGRDGWQGPRGLLRRRTMRGKADRVFAYAPAGGDGPFPAVLLVHGGWKSIPRGAEHWAGRGYCALAMDLAGNGRRADCPTPARTRPTTPSSATSTDKSKCDMWTYHAVTAILRGPHLLTTFPGVNKDGGHYRN